MVCQTCEEAPTTDVRPRITQPYHVSDQRCARCGKVLDGDEVEQRKND
jgi:hypothetical protein